MSDLRAKLIRLAHNNPELRPHLLPILKEASYDREFEKIWELFNKRDHFGVQQTIDNKIKQWEMALARGDRGAEQWTPETIADAIRKREKDNAYRIMYLGLKEALKKNDVQWLTQRVRYDQKFMLALAESLLGEKLPKSNRAIKEYFQNRI